MRVEPNNGKWALFYCCFCDYRMLAYKITACEVCIIWQEPIRACGIQWKSPSRRLIELRWSHQNIKLPKLASGKNCAISTHTIKDLQSHIGFCVTYAMSCCKWCWIDWPIDVSRELYKHDIYFIHILRNANHRESILPRGIRYVFNKMISHMWLGVVLECN